jgi:DNA mismatch endonuclease (patch repair protein)
MKFKGPSYRGLKPASSAASRTASRSSAKKNTVPELLLRRALHKAGLRYRIDVRQLPGRPDLVFDGARVAVFCDGDFWHGRGLQKRLRKLQSGHNAAYWVAKISANVARDRRTRRALASAGWQVIRIWESDVRRDPTTSAAPVISAVRLALRKKRRSTIRR